MYSLTSSLLSVPIVRYGHAPEVYIQHRCSGRLSTFSSSQGWPQRCLPPISAPTAHTSTGMHPNPEASVYNEEKQLTRIITGCESIQQLQELIMDHKQTFNQRHIVACLSRIGKLLPRDSSFRSDPTLEVVSKIVTELLEDLLQQTEESTPWGAVTLGIVITAMSNFKALISSSLKAKVIDAICSNLAVCTWTNVKNELLAVLYPLARVQDDATIRAATRPFIERIEAQLAANLQSQAIDVYNNDTDLGALAVAMARLEATEQCIDFIFFLAARQGLHVRPSRSMSMLARIMAQHGSVERSLEAADCLYHAVVQALSAPKTVLYTPSDAASFLLAFSTLIVKRFRDDSNASENYFRKEKQDMEALFKAHPALVPQIDGFAKAIRYWVPHMGPEDLEMTSYALCNMRRSHLPLLAALDARVEQCCSEMDAKAVAITLRSFALLRYDPSSASLDSLCDRLRVLIKSSETVPHHSAVMFLHSLAQLNIPAARRSSAVSNLLTPLVQMLKQSMPQLSKLSLFILGWSLVVIQTHPIEAYHAIARETLQEWREQVIRSPGLAMGDTMLSMVHHTEMALRIEHPDIHAPSPKEYEAFLQTVYSAGWMKNKARLEWEDQVKAVVVCDEDTTQSSSPAPWVTGKRGSAFQRQVMKTALTLSPNWQLEHWDSTLEYPVDVALPGAKLALEADGPTHYTFNTRRPMGSTALKRRLMRKIGWRVVDVPYFEWNRYNNVASKQQYLVQKIADLVGGASGVEEILFSPAAEDTTKIENGPALVEHTKIEMGSNDREIVSQRAARMDMIKLRQGRLSRGQVALKAAARATQIVKNESANANER